MNRDEIVRRKAELMSAAADRWEAKTPELASAAMSLARGGPMAAASPERAASFVARETLKRTLRFEAVGLERMIGPTLDWGDVAPTAEAKKAGRPVARIVELLAPGKVGDGFATGFVVRPGLLVTNWHVFASPGEAAGCGAQFGFERNDAGLLDAGVVFELDPQSFFHSDRALDIAVVGLKRSPAVGSGALEDYGSVRLIPSLGKILVGHPVSIIQHPDGRHKHWAVRENKLLAEPQDGDLFINYTTDTLAGSSGSPAFNHDWEMVAVHHMGVPRKENGKILTKTREEWRPGMPESEIDWIANEGVRISKVYAHLKQLKLPDAAQQQLLASLIAESTDPVMGGEMAAKAASVRAAAAVAERGEGSMNIVVNGTANFYIGREDARAEAAPPARVELPADLRKPPVGAEKKLKFDSDYANRPGYHSKFFDGFDVPPPTAPLSEVVKSGSKARVLKYHHYSLVMHETRRLVMWAAANVDYSENKRWRSRDEFGSDTWKPDPRIPIEAQIEDLEFYAPAAKFDRGHIIRRDDVAWGETMQEEEYGNSDSFHWTNCTPQHEQFNRDMFQYKGIWGQLENHIAREAGFLQNRLIVMAGPVLDPNDPSRDFGSGIEVQVPLAFWKILIAVEDHDQNPRLRAYGFILDQTEAVEQHGWEGRFRVGKFKEQQVSLALITDRSRVEFDQILHEADPLAQESFESRRKPLRTLQDLRLR